MASPRLIRWSGLAAVLGGVLLMVLGALAHMAEATKVLGLSEAAYGRMNIASLLLLAASLAGLYARQAGRLGRLGVAGFVPAFIGLSLMVLGNVIESWISDLIFADVPLGEFKPGAHVGWVIFLIGLCVLAVGFVLVGIATIQAKVLPRWSRVLPLVTGLLLASGFLLALSIGELGLWLLVLSLGPWMLLGYVVWSDHAEAPVQSGVGPPA
ncbi:MAG: hypothetical protein ACREJC_05870 [Tepidisphaeraceae bacterium]